ncbi:GNAT family N-acetyltransferase [Paenibacillus marinisediminis]
MIIKMTDANMEDFNKSNESFIVFGRIIPKYENDTWTYTEEIYSEPYEKQYANDDIDISYIEKQDRAVFLYYNDDKCVGQIRLRSHWNGYVFIEDIAVAQEWRHKGVGTSLLEKAAEWAKQNQHIGLMLETQDVNLSACRFYAKNKFIIGAVDTMLYSNFPTANERAIFWYRVF